MKKTSFRIKCFIATLVGTRHGVSAIPSPVGTRHDASTESTKEIIVGTWRAMSAKTTPCRDRIFLSNTKVGRKHQKVGRKHYLSTKSREKIVALLQQNSKLSAAAIADELSITAKAVEKHLANLKSAGIIQRIGPAKGGYWEVKNT